MDEPAIRVRQLTKRFRGRPAVNELTFDVPTGRVTGFLGPNGAGETTTLRMLLGLATPTSGTAAVLGRPYRNRWTATRWANRNATVTFSR